MNEKHLEFIQANISRMSQNSFHMKGWAITIIAALLALFAASIHGENTGNVYYIYVAILPTLIFWGLDSFYLQQERKFVGIYNDVIEESGSAKIKLKPFEMPLKNYKGGKYNFFRVAFSRTIWPLYVPAIIGLIIAGCILR